MTQQETINKMAQLADTIQVLRQEHDTAQMKTREARSIEDRLYVKLYYAQQEFYKLANQIADGPLVETEGE